jgi:hypothetical protein
VLRSNALAALPIEPSFPAAVACCVDQQGRGAGRPLNTEGILEERPQSHNKAAADRLCQG